MKKNTEKKNIVPKKLFGEALNEMSKNLSVITRNLSNATGGGIPTAIALAPFVGRGLSRGILKGRSFFEDNFGDLPAQTASKGSNFEIGPNLSPRIEYKVNLCRDIAQSLGQERFLTSLEEIVAQATAPLFQVLLVGRYNTGKSSVLNAFLGRQFLPEGAIPTTKSRTWLLPGESDFVLFEDTAGKLHPLEIESLMDTDPCNPLEEAQDIFLSLNHPFLASGVALIDTPGLEDPQHERSQMTWNALKTADAVVFVMDTYITEKDREFLKYLSEQGKAEKLFVLVNKMDCIEEEEYEDFLEERLQIFKDLGIVANIYFVSAKRTNLSRNHFEKFRSSLVAFLKGCMESLREKILEKKMDGVMQDMREMCRNALALRRQSAEERERIQIKLVRDQKILRNKVDDLIHKEMQKIDRIKDGILLNWRLCLSSIQGELREKIEKGTASQLKRRDFFESYVIGRTFQFLTEEIEGASHQIEEDAIDILEQETSIFPETHFSLEGEGGGEGSKVSPQMVTAGLLVLSYPLMGLFSWVQLLAITFMGRSLIEGFFSSLSNHMEEVSLRKKLHVLLEEQWPLFDQEVCGKIEEVFLVFKEEFRRRVQESAAVKEQVAALEASLTFSGGDRDISPETLEKWIRMLQMQS